MIDVAPKNLFSRFLLIIIIPIFLLLAISVYIFYERHWENVLSRMQDALVNDVKLLTELKKVHNEIFQNSAQVLGFDTETLFLHDNSDINIKGLDIPDRELQVLNSKLMVQLGKYVKSYYIKNAPRIKSFVYEGNEVTVYTYSNKKIHSPTTLVFILWMLFTGLLLIIISITFMKNQVRAIANLAIAAERLGKGQEIGDFRPSGAREVRVAGKAFLRMKERIERQISYRTELLAHISHDLRTPLTRIKLQLALLKEKKEAKSMDLDIKEMEKMLDGYITFAKEEGNEKVIKFDIVQEIKSCVERFGDKRIKFYSGSQSYIVSIKREAFIRVINNLISNAIKYAKKKILVSTHFTKTHFYLIVEDDGRGVPEKHHDKIFTPFIKLDAKKEGFGLGLAIVKNIVLGHGGKIKLSRSVYGGLKVSVRIPV